MLCVCVRMEKEEAVETDARHGKPGSMGTASRAACFKVFLLFSKGNQLTQ